MAKRKKTAAKPKVAKVKQGSVMLPALDVIRIVEHNCAGGHRTEYIAALFILYQRNELDNEERRRFERLIQNSGTHEEKKRLETLKE